jgi:hypothetical protein
MLRGVFEDWVWAASLISGFALLIPGVRGRDYALKPRMPFIT